MPTDPKPFESTREESSATDRAVRGRVADATGETESERPGINSSDETGTESDGDRNASDSDSEQSASDPDGDREAALERRVTEIEAELEAVRGLLDGVEAVDETVDQRASTALAKVEALEARLEPEEGRLVRERLPDADDGGARERVRNDQASRRRDGLPDSEPAPEAGPDAAGSRIRKEGVRNRRPHAETTNSPGKGAQASVGAVEAARNPITDTNTADGGSVGSGAISSVGSAAPDADTAAEATDRSLAGRLRDAFR